MNSFVYTRKNVKWRRLLWAAVYVTGLQSAGCVMCEYREHRPVAYYYRQHSYQAIDFMRCGDHNSYTKSVQHKTEHQEISIQFTKIHCNQHTIKCLTASVKHKRIIAMITIIHCVPKKTCDYTFSTITLPISVRLQ